MTAQSRWNHVKATAAVSSLALAKPALVLEGLPQLFGSQRAPAAVNRLLFSEARAVFGDTGLRHCSSWTPGERPADVIAKAAQSVRQAVHNYSVKRHFLQAIAERMDCRRTGLPRRSSCAGELRPEPAEEHSTPELDGLEKMSALVADLESLSNLAEASAELASIAAEIKRCVELIRGLRDASLASLAGLADMAETMNARSVSAGALAAKMQEEIARMKRALRMDAGPRALLSSAEGQAAPPAALPGGQEADRGAAWGRCLKILRVLETLEVTMHGLASPEGPAAEARARWRREQSSAWELGAEGRRASAPPGLVGDEGRRGGGGAEGGGGGAESGGGEAGAAAAVAAAEQCLGSEGRGPAAGAAVAAAEEVPARGPRPASPRRELDQRLLCELLSKEAHICPESVREGPPLGARRRRLGHRHEPEPGASRDPQEGLPGKFTCPVPKNLELPALFACQADRRRRPPLKLAPVGKVSAWLPLVSLPSS